MIVIWLIGLTVALVLTLCWLGYIQWRVRVHRKVHIETARSISAAMSALDALNKSQQAQVAVMQAMNKNIQQVIRAQLAIEGDYDTETDTTIEEMIARLNDRQRGGSAPG